MKSTPVTSLRTRSASSCCDLVGEQPEGLVGPDPVDALPVLGDESVLDAEEVERREVGGTAAPDDGAVPDAARGDPVALGHDVRLDGAAVGHRAAVDHDGARERRAAVGGPARVLDVALGDRVDVLGAPG